MSTSDTSVHHCHHLRAVAIDGKALCGVSSDERTRPYVVSAWADAQGIVLGQVRTMEKSNGSRNWTNGTA